MKTNQVICDANGQRKVTSTTETLRIKASEIEPGDWLLKPHGRVMRKDKLVLGIGRRGAFVKAETKPGDYWLYMPTEFVDVERTR